MRRGKETSLAAQGKDNLSERHRVIRYPSIQYWAEARAHLAAGPCSRPRLCNKEARVLQVGSRPHSAQLQKSPHSDGDPAKNKRMGGEF